MALLNTITPLSPPPIEEQSIDKADLNDLYGANVNIGSFDQKPNSEAILSSVKIVKSDFHNEAPSWYDITINDPINNNGVAIITPNDKCPYYTSNAWQVNWTLIDDRIDLTTLITPPDSPYAKNRQYFPSNYTDTQIIEIVKSWNPELNWNQIEISISTLNTNKVGTIHISASQGSNLYKNAKDVPFTTSFNPLLTGMNTPTPFVVTDSGIYASDRTHAYIAFNFTDNGQTGSPWWSNKGSYPKWFTIKLEKKYVLTYAAVWNYWEAERFTEVQILGGNDGSSWSQLADWAPTKLGTNIYGAYNDISNAIGYQYYMFNFPSGPNSYIRCDSVILSGYLDN